MKTKQNKVGSKIEEFKTFVMRGNVLDLAVGVIIGGAFGKIVSSLVDDILMPFIGLLLGGLDFTKLSFKIGDSVIQYGLFLQNVVDFFIIALSIFFLVKVINGLKRKKEEPPKPPKTKEVELLEEIRDLLKEKRERK